MRLWHVVAAATEHGGHGEMDGVSQRQLAGKARAHNAQIVGTRVRQILQAQNVKGGRFEQKQDELQAKSI